MKKILVIAAIVVGNLAAAVTAQAATVFSVLHEYGTAPGRVDPGGTDVLSTNYVTVSDSSTGRFNDRFDFSAFTGTITGLVLTATYSQAGPVCPLTVCQLGETWAARIQGSNAGGSADDYFVNLVDNLSPMSIVLDLSTDSGGIDAFSTSLANGYLDLWFSEFSIGGDNFRLLSVGLEVQGTAVPEPGSLALVGASLVGLGMMGQRKRRETYRKERREGLATFSDLPIRPN